jgi:hypothetical protein
MKPNIKNTLNKCRNGNPDIQRVITKAVKIKNAEEKLTGNIKKTYAKIGSQRGNKVSENLVFDNSTFERYLAE